MLYTGGAPSFMCYLPSSVICSSLVKSDYKKMKLTSLGSTAIYVERSCQCKIEQWDLVHLFWNID